VSQEQVEIVRRLTEAWQRDDFEAWLSLIDPDVAWLMGIERPFGSNAVHGHEGAREVWTVWRTEFDGLWLEIDAIRDLGGGQVLHLCHARARGRASGLRIGSELAQVMTVRNGKVVRSLDYLSHEEARAELGLAE
jgi:ketosteroid isomerase-like protein